MDTVDASRNRGAPQRPSPPRLGLTVAEAARAVGVSESSFKRHVQPELRIVRRGGLRIIPVSEIEKWLDGNATLAATTGSGRKMSQTKSAPALVEQPGAWPKENKLHEREEA